MVLNIFMNIIAKPHVTFLREALRIREKVIRKKIRICKIIRKKSIREKNPHYFVIKDITVGTNAFIR